MSEIKEMPDLLWSCENEYPDRDLRAYHDAIDHYLDAVVEPYPHQVQMYAFKRRVVEPEGWSGFVLESVLDMLDEEYGDPDDWTTPTEAMEKAALIFVETVNSEYTPWQHNRAPEYDEVTDTAPYLQD